MPSSGCSAYEPLRDRWRLHEVTTAEAVAVELVGGLELGMDLTPSYPNSLRPGVWS
jgi:hypothetical protein